MAPTPSSPAEDLRAILSYLGIDASVDAAITDFGLVPARRITIAYGASTSRVDGDVAAAATATFSRSLKALRDEGVRDTHMFLLTPAPLALLLGASINAGPAMTIYHADDGRYVRSIRLG